MVVLVMNRLAILRKERPGKEKGPGRIVHAQFAVLGVTYERYNALWGKPPRLRLERVFDSHNGNALAAPVI